MEISLSANAKCLSALRTSAALQSPLVAQCGHLREGQTTSGPNAERALEFEMTRPRHDPPTQPIPNIVTAEGGMCSVAEQQR